MYRLFISLAFIMVFASCGSSKFNIGSHAEEKNLESLLKQLEKKDAGPSLAEKAEQLYHTISENHLDKIELYQTLTAPSKYDKILNEYRALQQLNNAVQSSSVMRQRLEMPDYAAAIERIKSRGADAYYELGIQSLQQQTQQSYLRAYQAFSKAEEMIPGYKDVRQKINIAFEGSRLNIVINPVTDQTSYYNRYGTDLFSHHFNSDRIQRSLVRDLGGDYTKGAAARFYTDREAARADVPADWYIDLTWTRLDIPIPQTYTYTRNREKRIQTGTDTSGHPIYTTVNATLQITRRYFTAYGALESRITDADTRNNISLERYQAQVDWKQEYATYSGDRRALDPLDWAMVNNRTRMPDKEDILQELYYKIYPQLKNGISRVIDHERQTVFAGSGGPYHRQ